MGAPKPVAPAAEPLPGPANLSAGMACLLRRRNGRAEVEVEEPAVRGDAPALRSALPIQVSLVLADALLAVLAGWIMLGTHGNPGWGGNALCLLALVLGAWLSCLAVRLGRQRSWKTTHNPD